MTTALDKFQTLLRELFQFDCADLDFGIYRIMNYKRDVIERFITQDLPKAVAEELDRGALADQSQAAKELKEVAQQIKETLGKDALDADGNLAEAYHGTPLGKKYQDLKSKAAGARGREALEASIFNHLYAFFSRYYQDGDFISKRRYSKRQKYAIPYNGEEIYLYWANHDQYYVKTAEHFHDYTFTSQRVTVHFKIKTADVEQNNVKGDKRFFLPRVKEIDWDEKTNQVVIPFEYRPLTEQEEISYGKKNQQDVIIAEALTEIPKRLSPKRAGLALAALTAEKRKTAEGESISFLEHHLRQYTRRNTSDFFIHKHLKAFLSGELDFYLKNEVLNLDEMETAGEDRAEGWFQITRAIKTVGVRIIEFLDQIECFQKILWEKRKFITETQYCITVGNIDESFYPDIAACEPQWAEWKDLFHIDEEETDLFTSRKSKKGKRLTFLKAHPTLVLDTSHFEQDFADLLLASFDDIDEMTDGLLVHSENFQALNVLLEKYRRKVNCVYIDPPFNTSGTQILYKNNYRHSSWLSLISDRVESSARLMTEDGIICVAIDDFELPVLTRCLSSIFGQQNRLATVAVRSNPHGRAMAAGFSTNHEYALFYARTQSSVVGRLPRDARRNARYPKTDEKGNFTWINFRKTGAGSARADRPKLYYPIFVSRHGVVRVPSMRWSEARRGWQPQEQPRSDETVLFPLDSENSERVWNLGWQRAQVEAKANLLAKQVDSEWQVYRKYYANQEGALPGTWWDDAKYSATESGTKPVKEILGTREVFSYPKSVYLVEDCLRASNSTCDSVVLDFFAGSGTTGHAVTKMNREDEGCREYILVEIGEYFDTVLLPRIKKITFAPEWKDGKPERMATEGEVERSPRIIKYIRLESYEDALNNIEFEDQARQRALEFDDYLLKYMLRWETRKSETLLNLEKLASPFRYRLHIHKDGQSHEKMVDIPETFNCLLGLCVTRRRVFYDGDRRYLVYSGRIDHREIVVIWRETKGWTKEDLERDKKFVVEQKLIQGADEVFVNGDSFIPNAKALEPLFKARMFSPVEA